MSGDDRRQCAITDALYLSHTGDPDAASMTLLASATDEEKRLAALALVDFLPAHRVFQLAAEFYIDLIGDPEALVQHLLAATTDERIWFAENIDLLVAAHEERASATLAAMETALAELEESGHNNLAEMWAAEAGDAR